MRKPNKLPTRILFAGATLLVGLAALIARADYASTVTSLNPIAYWRFNETASSPALNKITNSGSLGSVLDGFVVADATLGQAGIVGNCMRLTNSGSAAGYCKGRIDVPWNAALNKAGAFSVECWVKPNSLADVTNVPGMAVFSCMMQDFASTSRIGYVLYVDSAGRFEFRMGNALGYVSTNNTGSSMLNAAVGEWRHVVCVFDGVTNRVYINGMLSASLTLTVSQIASLQQNSQMPFRLGGTPFNGSLSADDRPRITAAGATGNRGFDGWVDEMAYYGTALSANTIAAHFGAATTNNAGYTAQILADNPVGYWTYNESGPTPPAPSSLPIAANSGTLGSAVDGTNMWGVLAAQNGPDYAGFGPGNKAVLNDGVSGGYLGLPIDPGLNISGNITLMAWIKPTAKNFFRDIIAHGWVMPLPGGTADFQETFLRISRGGANGGYGDTNYYEVGVTDGAEGTYYDSAMFQMPEGDIGNWVFLAGTYDGANWKMYRNGSLVASVASANGALALGDRWSVGSRSDASPISQMYFPGYIDEPAIFNTALSPSQILAIYNAAQAPPFIIQQPQSLTVTQGQTATFTVIATGFEPLSYQWSFNGVGLPGATATNYTINSAQASDYGLYAVTVSNAFGSVTSAVVTLNVRVEVDIRIIKGLPQDRAAEQLVQRGAVILENSEYFQRISAVVDASRIAEIQGLPFVLDLQLRYLLVELNDGSRHSIGVDLVQDAPWGVGVGAPHHLSGFGVKAGVWDGGQPQAHQDFSARLTPEESSVPNAEHATHVIGTMSGDGQFSSLNGNGGTANQWAGMAPRAEVHAWDFFGFPQTEMLNARLAVPKKIDFSQNSWGASIASSASCYLFGDYTPLSGDMDKLVRDQRLPIFFAAGNSQDGKWRLVNLDGQVVQWGVCRLPGFGTVLPPGTAKNVVTVGAVTKLDLMTDFSSWGPTKDGRLKPDVVAVGQAVKSCWPNNIYHEIDGTSMACPAVSGTCALMIEKYRLVYPGSVDPSPALLKGILCNTATDLGKPGPDFKYGYGKVNALRAVEVIAAHQFLEGNLTHNGGQSLKLVVPEGCGEVRVLLAYSDQECLANCTPALINDLDLQLIDPSGTVIRPLTLDPTLPDNPAVAGLNRRDNVEQVVLSSLTPGNWTIVVEGHNVPQGPQDYALTWWNTNSGCQQPTVQPITSCGNDKTINCSDTLAFDPPTSAGTCNGGTVTATTLSTFTNQGCPKVVTRTWLVEDTCGNSKVCSQAVTVGGDTTPPVAMCAADKTVDCTDLWSFNSPTAVDACSGGNVTITELDTVTTGTNPQLATRTWKVEDTCGNSTTCSQIVTVQCDCAVSTFSLNTGFNHLTGTTYPIGAGDAFWTVVADQQVNTKEPRPATVITGYAVWAPPAALSEWISFNPTSTSSDNGDYIIETSFCLQPGWPGVTLTVGARADDAATICLNGTVILTLPEASWKATVPLSSVTIMSAGSTLFKTGPNVLRVTVKDTGNVATGLNLVGSVAGEGVFLEKPQCCQPYAAISGQVFHDQNGDGVRNNGEQGLEAWIVYLSNGQIARTDVNGYYYFMNLNPGSYTVTEEQRACWPQTAPAGGAYTVTLVRGQILKDLNFGNQNWLLIALTAGAIASCYPSVAAAEDAALAASTAADNGNGTPVKTASTVGTCRAVITVTATGGCGNSASVAYNTRIDATPPVIHCPANIVVGSCMPVTYRVTTTDDCSKPKVALYGSHFGSDSESSDVRAKLIASGLFSLVDNHSGCPLSTPSLDDLKHYDAVFVWSDLGCSPTSALGDVLAEYLNSGGGVVVATFAFSNPSKGGGLIGGIKDLGYLPFTTGGNAPVAAPLTMMSPLLPNHKIVSGVSSFSGGRLSAYLNSPIQPTSGTDLIARWSNEEPLMGAKQLVAGGRIAGLNFFPPSDDVNHTGNFWDPATDGAKIMANALAWVAKSPITPICSPPSGSTFPLGTTTVNCVATDACGNTANSSFTVTVVDTTVVTISASPGLTLCAGQSTTLTANATGGTAPYSYRWSGPDGPTDLQTRSASIGGDYTVIVTGANGCTATATVTLTVNPPPTVTVNSATMCAGGSATIAAAPIGSGPWHYAWTGPGATAPGDVASFSATVAGNYHVVVTDGHNCSSASATGSLAVNPLPTVTVTVNPATVCAGVPATITSVPIGSGPWHYAWTVPTGATVPGDVASFSTTTAGSYSVVVTDGHTCKSVSASGSLTVNPLPTVTVNSIAICAGISATITAAPIGSGPWQYAWEVPTSATAPGDVASFSATVAGSYRVVVTDGHNCSSAGASGSLTVNPLPTVTISALPGLTICPGRSATLTANPKDGTAPYTYSWNGPDGTTIDQTCSASSPGDYTVTVTDGNRCTGTATATVRAADPRIHPTVIAGSIPSCFPTVAAAESAALAASTTTDNSNGLPDKTACTAGTCRAVITVTVADVCGNYASVAYNTRIDNTPPVINCPSCIRVTSDTSVQVAYTVTATDNCPGTAKPKVALYASEGPGRSSDVREKLNASGLFSVIDNHSSCGFPTPTLDDLLHYDAVFVWSDCNFVQPVVFGNVLADYLRLGRGVVIASVAFDATPGEGLDGGIQDAGFLPFTEGDFAGYDGPQGMIADLPSHPILAGISSFRGGGCNYHNAPIWLTAGTHLVAHWSNGQPLIGAKQLSEADGRGRVVGLNFYPPSSDAVDCLWASTSGGAGIIANALAWAAKSTAGPKVALYSSETGRSADVWDKLDASGLFSVVDDHSSCGFSTPTLRELQQYDAVFVWNDCDFVQPVTFGDVLADYLDSGHGLVMAAVAFDATPGQGLDGRIQIDGYLPFTEGDFAQYGGPQHMIADAPCDPVLLGVASFRGGVWNYHNAPISLTTGTRLVAHWSDGGPLIGVKQMGGARIAGLNFYPPSSDADYRLWDSTSDGAKIMANALLWAAKSDLNVCCNPPSSSVFPVGTTPVHCVATDSCGNSASCDFTVTVVPLASHIAVSIHVDSAGSHLVFSAEAGLTYVVEYSATLVPPSWNLLQTVVGDGLVHDVLDPVPLASSRFYRVRVFCP